ncbi:MAG: S41 family peptidase [Pseudobdellovibrionaceae bacterium]|nr:S41 family peptidase [Bdellovibrionales bacterium]USN49032.1 MAG: S41 family peptidase [Pseudobdellovibrionaceae bacterium]
MRDKKRWVVATIGALLLAAGILNFPKMQAWAEDRYLDLQLFTKVLNLVQQYYVEEVDTKKLIYGGIKGMLSELDPHTNFLPPTMYKEFESETAGEFGGLGIEITVKDDVLTVISPVEDAPAWKAGIKAGDRVVGIDGESTKGLSLVEAAQKMRGKKGSTVKLLILREGLKKPKEIAVTRGTVKLQSVKYVDMDEGYAYVRLTGFMDKTSKDLVSKLKDHEKKHKNIKGLIIDLRKNPGGLLDQAIKISDLFLDSGVIVTTMGRNQKRKEAEYAKKSGTLGAFPMVVLVDEYSASASEILAGALQDNNRALIMGQRSFGKGSVQSVVRLGDGSALKLTVARYYTPNGRSIQAEGIVPDIIVDNFSAEELEKARIKRMVRREADIKGHLLSEKEINNNKNGDSESPLDFWWASETESKDKKLSIRDELIKNDFQVLQAFNYLKAWKTLKQFKEL